VEKQAKLKKFVDGLTTRNNLGINQKAIKRSNMPGYDFRQFKQYIGKVLKEYSLNPDKPELYSASAVNLLLGTAAKESEFGACLWQRGLTIGKRGIR
jgi:hypothetical protein